MIAEALLSKDYVGSGDFALKGITEMEVEVVEVKREPVFNPGKQAEETKWVASLSMKGKALSKRLILGAKANLRPLVAAFGPDEKKWPGRKFTLYVGDHRGQPCLRVKDPK
jgi:hypothetical protein